MKQKLILIDASGLLFRSFFAMMKNPLRTKNGQATSAVFGFLRMIFNLIKKYPCHSIVAAFDVPRSTLKRTKKYHEYKATRKETPEELISQIPLAKKCLLAAKIPAISIDGYEADDVLASFVKKYQEDMEILIFTGDKDLLQLVNDNVQVVLPDKNHTDRILDKNGVKEYKGVYPDEIKDYLAIVGDTSDNIPGVKGIGDKGAIELIEEFHSLDNIYKNLDKIKPTLSKKLEESKENAFLSQDLIRLQQDLPVQIDHISEKLLTVIDCATPEFIDWLKELELFSLLKELANIKGTVGDKDAVISLFDNSEDIDIQEFGLNTLDILSNSSFIGLQIIDKKLEFATAKEVFHLPFDKIVEYSKMLIMFFEMIINEEKSLIVFDQKVLIHLFNKYQLLLPKCDDIKIMAYLLDPVRNKYDIEYLSLFYLSQGDPTARCFFELKQTLGKSIVADGMGKIYYNIEMPLRPILTQLEITGIKIDKLLLEEISNRLENQLTNLEKTIYHLAGKEFNILSPKQLGQILFEDLGLKPFKKTKTKSYSTDEESLESLALIHPLPKEVLQYRSLSKFKSTYTDALPKLVDKNDRLHTTLHQTVTATGRLSSGDPNLQNIPIRTELGKEIRSAFIPKENMLLVSADYSQIELRLFASFSNDEKMKTFFLKGGDIHRHTAAEIFKIPESDITPDQRRTAKTINYGISYGMSAFRLANELEIEFSQAREFINNYFETFPGIQEFMMKTLEFACANGYVKTLNGRRRPTPELLGKTPDKLTNLSHPSRFAINAVVQGTAADIIKMAMIRVQDMIRQSYDGQVRMILQVHDELIFEVSPEILEKFNKELKNIMIGVIELIVPLDVEVGYGANWTEAH